MSNFENKVLTVNSDHPTNVSLVPGFEMLALAEQSKPFANNSMDNKVDGTNIKDDPHVLIGSRKVPLDDPSSSGTTSVVQNLEEARTPDQNDLITIKSSNLNEDDKTKPFPLADIYSRCFPSGNSSRTPEKEKEYIKLVYNSLIQYFPGINFFDNIFLHLRVHQTIPAYMVNCLRLLDLHKEENITDTIIRALITTEKDMALNAYGITKNNYRLLSIENKHHRNMIFEAALIACLALHPSNDDLHFEVKNNKEVFRQRYGSQYEFKEDSHPDFQMFLRYYWTTRVACPYLNYTKNLRHSLQLIPPLVEARSVEYLFGGNSSGATKLRVQIYRTESNTWRDHLYETTARLDTVGTVRKTRDDDSEVGYTSKKNFEDLASKPEVRTNYFVKCELDRENLKTVLIILRWLGNEFSV
jgi:hypothetical protein